jgi:hypothetical protein
MSGRNNSGKQSYPREFNPNLTNEVTPLATQVNYTFREGNLPPVAKVRRNNNNNNNNNIPHIGSEEIERRIAAGEITPTTNMSGTEVGKTVFAYPVINQVRSDDVNAMRQQQQQQQQQLQNSMQNIGRMFAQRRAAQRREAERIAQQPVNVNPQTPPGTPPTITDPTISRIVYDEPHNSGTEQTEPGRRRRPPPPPPQRGGKGKTKKNKNTKKSKKTKKTKKNKKNKNKKNKTKRKTIRRR